MSEDFGADFITISDEDGNEYDLEILDVIEFEGKEYTAFVPADIDEMDPEDPDYGIVILENAEVDGEQVYNSVDDEALLDRVYDYYMTLIDEEEPEEE